MIIDSIMVSLFQVLKSIYNGMYNSIFFVDNNKILRVAKENNIKIFKNLLTLIID